MELFWQLNKGWNDLMDNKSDQRTKNWMLMSSPFPSVAICLSYVCFVKVIGPKMMRNRKPFKLTRVMIIYNLLQVLFNGWIFYETGVSGWLSGYSYRCQAVDYSRSYWATRMAEACWWYYINKFTDFFDTLFFILRKKNDQFTTLHVVHHGIMPFSGWCVAKFFPGGHGTFCGFLNTFVHILMYSYYMLAAMGPKVQKYLWWKKYLTILQMAQFVAVFIHSFQLLIWNPCLFPLQYVFFQGLHAILFLALFKHFYDKAYKKTLGSQKCNGDLRGKKDSDDIGNIGQSKAKIL